MYTQAIAGYGRSFGEDPATPLPADPVACAQAGGSWDQMAAACSMPAIEPIEPNGNGGNLPWIPEDPAYQEMLKWRARAYWVIRPAAVVNGLYHGYKRNNSVGWSLAWGFFAMCLPVTSAIFSVAQKPGWSKTKTGR